MGKGTWVYLIECKENGKWVWKTIPGITEVNNPSMVVKKAAEISPKANRVYKANEYRFKTRETATYYDNREPVERPTEKTRVEYRDDPVKRRDENIWKVILDILFKKKIIRWAFEPKEKVKSTDTIWQILKDGKWQDAYLNYTDANHEMSVLDFLRSKEIKVEKNWERAIDQGLKLGIIRSRIPAGKEELAEYTKKKTKEQVFEDAVTQAGSHKAKIKIGNSKIYLIDDSNEFKEGVNNKFLKDSLSYAPGKKITFIADALLESMNPFGPGFNVMDILGGIMYVPLLFSGGVFQAFSKMKFNFDKYIKKEGKEVLKPLPMMSSKELEWLQKDIDKIQKELKAYTHDQQAWDLFGAVPGVGNIAVLDAIMHVGLTGMSAIRSVSASKANQATKEKNIGSTLTNSLVDWGALEIGFAACGVFPGLSTFTGLLSAYARHGAYKWAAGYLSSFRTAISNLHPEVRKQEKEGLNAAIRDSTWEEVLFSISVWRQYDLSVNTIFEDLYNRNRDIKNLKKPYLDYMPDDPYCAVKMVNSYLVAHSIIAPTSQTPNEWGQTDTEIYIDEVLKPYLMYPLQLLEINSGRYYVPAYPKPGDSDSTSTVSTSSAESRSNQLDEIRYRIEMPPSFRLPTSNAQQDLLIINAERGDQPPPSEFYLTEDDWYNIERELNNNFGSGTTSSRPFNVQSEGGKPQSHKSIPAAGYGAGVGFSSYTPIDLGLDSFTPPGGGGLGAGFNLGGGLGAYLLAPFKESAALSKKEHITPMPRRNRTGKFTERLFQIPQMMLTASPLEHLFAAGGSAGNLLGGLSEPAPPPQIVHRFERGSVQIHTQKIDAKTLGNAFVSFLQEQSRK